MRKLKPTKKYHPPMDVNRLAMMKARPITANICEHKKKKKVTKESQSMGPGQLAG